MMQAGKVDLKILASGLIPSGFDATKLTPEGRDEVRAAIDVICRLWDHRNARLTLALEQLDKSAVHIEQLNARNHRVGKWLSSALDDPSVCEEMKADIRYWLGEEK